ncbi:MAG: FAD-dependent oxidoreductase [Brevinemataceae bacterium]
MKIIVIGNNHAGTAFVNNVHKYNKNVEVVTYERNDNISFLACGIALWVGGTVKDPKGLFYANAEELGKKGIKVNMKHDVLSVDFDKKTVKVKDLNTGREFEDNYDKLVLAAGSWPNVPPFAKMDLPGVFLAKTYQHAQQIIEYASKSEVKHVTVVGAGYIGVELVESFRHLGKEVLLLEGSEKVLNNYFDPEFTVTVEETMKKNGIDVHTQEYVKEIQGTDKVTHIQTDKGTYQTDMIVLATGFHPNTELYEGKLKTISNGAVVVNEYMQTSDSDVYACGDCIAVLSNVVEGSDYIALATNAVRTGIVCAANIVSHKVPFLGVQGSNAIKIFDLNMASTGFSEYAANKRNYQVLSNFVEDAARPEFMPVHPNVKVKVVYDAATRRILGAQIQSTENHTEVIHTFSLAIEKKMTIDELALTDFFFLPHFNKPISWLTAVCLDAK